MFASSLPLGYHTMSTYYPETVACNFSKRILFLVVSKRDGCILKYKLIAIKTKCTRKQIKIHISKNR